MSERIHGTIAKIIFFSQESGYGVVQLKVSQEEKTLFNINTVTCVFDRKPLIDEEYEFMGKVVSNNYGLQFSASSFSRKIEETLEGVVNYLSSEFFPGIGAATAKKVYDQLGPNCLNLIRSDRKVLDNTTLNKKQKDIIYNCLIENSFKEETIVGLLKIGLTSSMAIRIMSVLKEKTLDIVNNNPYSLIDLVDGIGFLRADRIALSNGVKKNDFERIQALILYILEQYTFSSGDTYIARDELLSRCIDIVNKEEEIIDSALFDESIKKLITKEKIYVDEEKNIYEMSVYNSENLLASYVVSLLKNEFDYGYELSKVPSLIANLNTIVDIDYSEKQIEAIKAALCENLTIITGGPGTGKSTVIKGIIESYSYLFKSDLIREEIALLAPTGRASKRLVEVCSHPAQTIHRFLGYEGGNNYRHGEYNKVDARLVIVDEASMLDTQLASRLFSSLEEDTKVVLVGDVDQLPSVGVGEVLRNLIESKEIKVVRLDRIHRQAASSTIVSLAHSINNGIIPDNILEKQSDRNFILVKDIDLVDNTVKTIERAVKSGMSLQNDIQVLAPMYKGESGINALNEAIQKKFNPFIDEEIEFMSKKFRVNDKVIQLVNRSEKKIMNGDIGYIHSLDIEKGEVNGLTVRFDNGNVYYKKDELEDLSLAYAISIHKSQGSEFACVIIPFTNKYYIMLKRKLIYTAVTRAKKYLIMLGNIEALSRGVVGVENRRKTKLLEKIKSLFNNDLNSNFEKNEMENISPYDFLD